MNTPSISYHEAIISRGLAPPGAPPPSGSSTLSSSRGGDVVIGPKAFYTLRRDVHIPAYDEWHLPPTSAQDGTEQ